MMRVVAIILSIVVVALLVGCATGYAPSGGRTGYSETQVAPDTYTVTYRVKPNTSEQRAVDFALLRSAELTLRDGYTHFVVLELSDRSHYRGEHYWPACALTVKMGDADLRSPNSRPVYDAAFVQKSIRERYDIDK